MKRLPMRKIREALRLSHEGLSTRVMAPSLDVGRTTLRAYLSRARDVGLSWPLPHDLTDADLEQLLFPRRRAGNSDPIPLPDWAYVHAELRRKGVTLLLLWQEYREVHPEGNRQHSTIRDHMPANHRYRTDWTPERIRTQAARIGPNVEAFVEMDMRKRRHPEQGYRLELDGQSFRKQDAQTGDATPES